MHAKEMTRAEGREVITKTSIMLGVGEEEEEVVDALRREYQFSFSFLVFFCIGLESWSR